MPTSGQDVAQGASVGGSIALTILGASAAAGPIGLAIGGAVAAISMLSGTITKLIDGCGQSCVQATDIVNQAETYVQEIASAYWNAPEHTKSLQAYTLQQLDAIFDKVRALCGQIPGNAGLNCVKERLTRGYLPPWCVTAGLTLADGCGGWYDVTYDPIANDPSVVPDPTPVSAVTDTISSAFSGLTGGGYGPVLLVGSVIGLLIILKVRDII